MITHIKKEDGVYFLDSYCKDTTTDKDYYLGTLILDVKRNTYYLTNTMLEKSDDLDESYVNEVKKVFLNALAEKVEPSKMTGELKVYAKDLLMKMFDEENIANQTTNDHKQKKMKIN